MNKDKLFDKFKTLFLEKNKVINLISKNDETFLDEKHIFDSLSIRLFFEKYGTDFKTLLDIGTGGGFPSIPIAIEYPNLQVTALDSIRKKIASITEITQALELKNITPICARVETIEKKFDIITSRAVARLKTICEYALPLLNKNGYLIVYKSKLAKEEIDEAQPFLKIKKAKVDSILEYSLPMKEHFERNLIVIRKA